LGEIPGERMGYSIACVPQKAFDAPGGAAPGTGLPGRCAIIAIGAPWAHFGPIDRAGRVYGFVGPEVVPVNNTCCATPPCFDKCWKMPSGSVCPAPELTITAPTSTGSGTPAIQCTQGGLLTFTVTFDPKCLPPGTLQSSFVIMG